MLLQKVKKAHNMLMINFYEPLTAYLNEQRDSQYAYDILIFVS